ncbi:AI-2E family transporter [Brumimicrobium glaciale]|jgi:predicted PurR-regulated permease PerM|uniref:AI-2E family transporter n=1 Tax=Brumimicrobium glaciale TaxID=200475 RepID=A0A4Q4KCW8_9FLAO|nr:AI-2E family transporter [Brumimicrobium glaciale]RYM30823.1 AI-2E family transporter [Brumimicrobium glaciale]
MTKSFKYDKTAKVLFIVAFIVLALYFFTNVLMPIIFSAIVSLILLPIVKFFDRIGINKSVSVTLTVLILLIFTSGIVSVLVFQSQSIVVELPKMMNENENFLHINPDDFTASKLGDMISIKTESLQEYLSAIKGGLISMLEGGYKGLSNMLMFLITCPVYIFFMLLYRNNVYRFIKESQRKSSGNKDSDEVIDDVKHSLYQYIKGMLIVMLVVGTLTYVGLLLLGIKYALFLGILTALLTPLPYIGVIISATIPIIIAMLTKDTAWYIFGVVAVFAFVQFLEGNVITPKIMGSNVNINPLIIILSLVIFGAISGLVGMILTVPILAVIKVIVEHSPNLKRWQYLMEDKKT